MERSLKLNNQLQAENRKDFNKKETQKVKIYADGRIYKTFSNGSKTMIFPDGKSKQKLKDGTLILIFSNRDIKTIHPDGSESYQYAQYGITKKKLPDGKCEISQIAASTEQPSEILQ